MRDDGVYLGIKATTGEVFVVNRNGVWLARTFRRKTARERWERTNLEMIVAVLWRMNDDDAKKKKGKRLFGEVVNMEKLKLEERFPVPKRVYIRREDLEIFGFTARCLGCMSLLKEMARHAHTENCRSRLKGVERHCEGGRSSTKAREGILGQSSRETNRTKSKPGGRTDGCANNKEFEQQRGTGIEFKQQWRGSESRQPGRGQWIQAGWTKKRKADGEHLEDPDREDGKRGRMVFVVDAGNESSREC